MTTITADAAVDVAVGGGDAGDAGYATDIADDFDHSHSHHSAAADHVVEALETKSIAIALAIATFDIDLMLILRQRVWRIDLRRNLTTIPTTMLLRMLRQQQT